MNTELKNVRLDKTALKVFHTFAEAEADERAYWHSRTPQQRLSAMELMRQSAYGYDASATPRLQRVLEIAQRKSS